MKIKTRTLLRKLVKIIDLNTEYPVNYTINQYGERVRGKAILKGSDLTENQIFELWENGLITTT